MKIIDAIQGSAEWHEHRSSHFNASDAPAMMGISPYKTRSELLREIATGLTPEIDPATQRRFDDGHRFEALARPFAESIVGEELFPVVGYVGNLSASFDGLTMDGAVCFEHKTLNAAYREAITTGSTLPAALLVQIEQQLMIADATRCLFMASKWTPEDTLIEEVHCFVASDPELRNAIIQGWTQFAIDLEAYEHTETVAAPVAATIEALPALFVQVEGKVLATNLDAFKLSAQTFIDKIKTELVTDQDFADADKMVKFLKDGEERLALAKSQALSQTASIDELFRTVDSISEQMKAKRLALDKLVKSEKDNRRAYIVAEAQQELVAHVTKLNERIGGNWMPRTAVSFADAIKGLKSLDSMRDKVSAALANSKIEANEIADRIQANRFEMIGELDWSFLFPDFAAVCTKARDDFDSLLMARIAKHNEAQAAKDAAAKAAEDARVAAAVEAERKAGEARAAEAVRIAAAIQEDADKISDDSRAQFDQRGKADEARPSSPQTSVLHEAASASTPPTPEHSSALAASDAEAVIDDFISLLPMTDIEKRAHRLTIVKWEKYRVALLMKVAA